MPVNTPHPLYTARAAEWQRCRDAYDGEDAVKSRGNTYLPRLGSQTEDAYKAYVKRAMYFEAVGRTIDGFVGAIARKPAEIEAPPKLDDLIADASADGISLGELVKRLAIETILQGRSGVLVDWDDKKKRSYLSLYTTENITGWSDSHVVLRETVYEPDAEDKFKQVAIEQYRELTIVEGAYTVNIWRKAGPNSQATAEWVIYQTITPMRVGKALTELPFFWLTPLGKTNRIERPPLLGLVNIALSHYRNSADLEHGRHFTGLPTPIISGDAGETPITIGSTQAILLQDFNAKAYYLEFNGEGLGSLERALEHKEAQMAALGAAVFEDAQRKGVEAAEAARIRISGSNSLLIGVVDAIEETMRAALECAANWMGAGGTVTVKLNRDFIESTIEPQALQAIVAAYIAGAMSLSQFLYVLKKHDLLAPETDIEAAAVTVAAEASARAKEAAALEAKSKPTATA